MDKVRGKTVGRYISENEDESVSSAYTRSDLAMLNSTESAFFNRETVDDMNWCLDSGCSAHVCAEEVKFDKIKCINKVSNLANNESTSISSVESVKVYVSNSYNEISVNFEKVYYVPDLRANLLSISKITDHGYDVNFRKDHATVTNKNGETIFRADRIGELYYVRKGKYDEKKVNVAMSMSNGVSEIDEWHSKLGHLNERDLKYMAKTGAVYGLDFKGDQK
ncbi:uncharacterized protein LOC143187798 [Calliopsis andreniformis]|uniref:uncharacterized protein LOC143187798 n=1 Tax=Calliopsis andreniformis TaxID=337506 RepID=UPI003FCC5F74